MKLLVAVVVVVAVAGCPSLTTVVVPAESEIEVPGSVGLNGNPLAPDDVFPPGLSEALAQSIAQSFDTAGYDKDAVDSLKLTKMKMTVTEPNEGNNQVRGLGFLEKLTISLGAEGVDAVVVAESDAGAFDGDPGPVEYDMPLTDAELQPVFVAAEQMDMTADLVPSTPPNFATTVLFETELTIQVNVIGAIN
ncbi:MAG: hypothetical protein Q8O67_27015 [Deltaproteobacteria bacterium]|nr:hypothetical protein [Deltaproteobacteria bacterium]